MKAVICKKFGSADFLVIEELQQPVPTDYEVLIKVRCTTVTMADWRVLTRTMPLGFKTLSGFVFGFSAPRNPILGTELSGTVLAIGKNVSKFKVGDSVIGVLGAGFGCHTEFRCMHENANIFLKPEKLSFAEAAALPFGSITAYDYLKNKAKIQSGEHILIHGASGAVGSAAIQIAKYFGAIVTAICSARNFDFVKALGADFVIDYTKENFLDQPKTYDIILDAVGTLSFAQSQKKMTDKGRLLLVSGSLPEMLAILYAPLFSSKRVIAGPASESQANISAVLDLAAQGKIRSPIDQEFDFSQIRDAYRYVETGRKRGNVVIKVA